jgi:DNA-binding response OmpR family regulator
MAWILVVDDDEIMWDMLMQMLTLAGHEVSAACNGREAEAACAVNHFDLAVVDMVMPGEDGFLTVEKLVRAYAGIKIIGISGGDRSFDGTTYLDLVKERGAHRTFTKPFERSVFLAAVKELLGTGS